MSDRLPQVELNESALTDTEQWPEWREPPIEVTDALKQTQTNSYADVPEAVGPYRTEPKGAAVEASSRIPKKPKAARFADRGDNVRAAVAQLAILLPFIGPMIAFAMSPAGSPGRRSAAKAFNGQALAALSLLTVVGAVQIARPHLWPLDADAIGVLGAFGVIGGWLLQVLIAVIAAATGHDWTSPLTRILRLRILPEGGRND